MKAVLVVILCHPLTRRTVVVAATAFNVAVFPRFAALVLVVVATTLWCDRKAWITKEGKARDSWAYWRKQAAWERDHRETQELRSPRRRAVDRTWFEGVQDVERN